MNLNNISFPYPVMGSFDDIFPLPENPVVTVSEDQSNYHFVIKLEYDNPDIKSLVDNDYADYACEVDCVATRYVRCYKGKLLEFQIDIPRRSVAGKIVFSCTIVVKKTIYRYQNTRAHSDYRGHSFTMEPGDILGIFPQFYYTVDIKYDKLKAVGTFMEINKTCNEYPQTILDSDKIELYLPYSLYEQYKHDSSINGSPDILHASLVLNALTYALCRIDRYEETKWAQTIQYRIDTEEDLKLFRGQDSDDWQVDVLAQKLLGKPYARMFDYLSFNNIE